MNALRGAVVDERLLLEERVQLDLIGLRLHLGMREEVLDLLRREVRDADMARQAFCLGGFHCAPRACIGASAADTKSVPAPGKTALGFRATGRCTTYMSK